MRQYLFIVLLLISTSCSNERSAIEGVWWYLDGSVYHEIEFLEGRVFDRRSFRTTMSQYTLSNQGAYTTDSNVLLMKMGPKNQIEQAVTFELDATGTKLYFTEKRHSIERVEDLELSIGRLTIDETPVQSDKWKKYIKAFYVREFNSYIKHELMSETNAKEIRDSLTAFETALWENN